MGPGRPRLARNRFGHFDFLKVGTHRDSARRLPPIRMVAPVPETRILTPLLLTALRLPPLWLGPRVEPTSRGTL
jgi:hypothetical protein